MCIRDRSEVARAITPSTGPEQDNWYRTQAAWQGEQLGQARILVLCRSENIGQAVARGLAMTFSEIPCPLVFLTCDSIERAHRGTERAWMSAPGCHTCLSI